VRIPNEPVDDPGGPLSELLRLQSQFQSRLAEETLSYLRSLQGAAAPAVPGTVLVPDSESLLEARGQPGGSVELALELENRQRVHCMVRPLLGELVSATGVTWQPDAEARPPSRLVAPGEVIELVLVVSLPAGLPPTTYRGSLLLLGFRKGALPVAISVATPRAARKSKAAAEAVTPVKAARKSKATVGAVTPARAARKSKAAAGPVTPRKASRKSKAVAGPVTPAKPSPGRAGGSPRDSGEQR
jgi:hypothetical protein